MSRIILELGSCSVVLFLFLPGAPCGEVVPTRKTQPLFKEPSFQTPANWQVRTMPNGQKFVPVLYYGTFLSTVETKDGRKPFSKMPWAKDAIVRIRYDELKDPAVFKDLLENKTNPIMFFGEGDYLEPYLYPGKGPAQVDEYFDFVVKTKKAFGSRFLCFDYAEWCSGGVGQDKRELTLSCKRMNISLPKNRGEAAAWWDKRYDLVFKRYQDAGIPVFAFTASSMNHYEARMGTSYTGNEICYSNPAMDSTLLAFCRGASRQFNIPWGSYAAGFGGNWGHNHFSEASPERRIWKGGTLHGAYSSLPFQVERCTMYSVYMGGGNFLIRENDGGMTAGYDPLTVERTDPRIIALTPFKQHAGPFAVLSNELYEKVEKKQDRGTPYTPIALMFDKSHGLAFRYSRSLAIGSITYTAAEEQMRGVLNTVFPYEAGHDAVGPFGEIFDVLTTDAPAPLLNSYRAITLVGQPRVDLRLAGVLKEYVKNGGLLFMACEQMTPELWSLAGISDTGKMGQDAQYLRASDFYVYNQGGFEYHKVKLEGAESLFVAGKYEERVWPVATINRVGKGAVVVGTPVWLNVKGDPSKMHSLFSEIMTMIADELVPVKVYGSEVKVMFNRNETGWVVTLMNNKGLTIAYPGYKPAERKFSSAGVVLKPRFQYAEATEWLTGQELAGPTGDACVNLIIPPGEVRIVEFGTRKARK